MQAICLSWLCNMLALLQCVYLPCQFLQKSQWTKFDYVQINLTYDKRTFLQIYCISVSQTDRLNAWGYILPLIWRLCKISENMHTVMGGFCWQWSNSILRDSWCSEVVVKTYLVTDDHDQLTRKCRDVL